MFAKYFRKPATFLRSIGDKPVRRRRPAWSASVVEVLESRDLPAPLTWAAGVNLPVAAAGIVAQPEGTSLLVLPGPTTSSYNLSVTDPTWQAIVTPTVQPLDFARTSPGVGQLSNGYFIVFGGMQNGFATSAVTQYDPNTLTIPDGASNQTRSLRSMNTPRARVRLGHGFSTHLSYAIGGQDNNGTPLATVEVYNPSANTWTYRGFVAANHVLPSRPSATGLATSTRSAASAPTEPSSTPSIVTPSRPTPGIRSPHCRSASAIAPRCWRRTA